MSTDPADFACTCGEPHYVYRCYDDTGQLLYIGVARDVKKRLLGHRRSHSEVAQRTARTTTVLYPDRAHALAAEAEAIATDAPLLNVRHNHSRVKGAGQKVKPSSEERRAAINLLGT